jgi:hypothetical protein
MKRCQTTMRVQGLEVAQAYNVTNILLDHLHHPYMLRGRKQGPTSRQCQAGRQGRGSPGGRPWSVHLPPQSGSEACL